MVAEAKTLEKFGKAISFWLFETEKENMTHSRWCSTLEVFLGVLGHATLGDTRTTQWKNHVSLLTLNEQESVTGKSDIWVSSVT